MIEEIGLRLEAKPESPAVNPAFVVEDWGKRDVRLKVNGQEIKRGKDFRFGHVRRVNRYDLVVWVRLDSEQTGNHRSGARGLGTSGNRASPSYFLG